MNCLEREYNCNCLASDAEDMDNLKDIFEKVLRSQENDSSLTITSISEDSCNVGDNFMSIASAVNVVGISGSGSLYSRDIFVKRPVESKERREFCCMEEAFKNEAFMYCKVLPLVPGVSEMTAKCLLATKDIILMENLRSKGYRMLDKMYGLDLAHAELVMKATGKFHAGTYNIKITKGEVEFENLTSKTFDFVFENKQFITLLTAAVESGVKNLKLAEDETLDPIIRKLEEIIKYDDLHKILQKTHDSNNLSVIVHGDLWTNNMLFHYDEDDIVDGVKLLDFQMPRKCSLAIDLWTFFYTSISTELLETKSEYLISVYTSTFINTLKLLETPDVNIPSNEEIQREINSRELYGFLLSLWYLTGILIDFSDNNSGDIDNALRDKEGAISSFFTVNAVQRERFSILGKRCLARGVLSYNNIDELGKMP